jgi:ribose transport system permease protein
MRGLISKSFGRIPLPVQKLAGIALFLLVLYGALLLAGGGAASIRNHQNLAERIGLFGILTLAAGLVIVTGNIDLSIGSTVGLCTTVTCILLIDRAWHPAAAFAVVIGLGVLIGLLNGAYVTYLRVQAFVVTLCGMYIYRSMARWVAGDFNKGLGDQFRDLKAVLRDTWFGVPTQFIILLALLALATVLLHFSIIGRYFYALGSNERAARFSGVSTSRYKILAFVLCSTLTAFYSFLHVLQYNTAQPSGTGSMYELDAIAGAVLGGYSLRGGDGTVLGVLIGTSIIVLLRNVTEMWGISSTLQGAVIGAALLFGATLDEFLRRQRAVRKG